LVGDAGQPAVAGDIVVFAAVDADLVAPALGDGSVCLGGAVGWRLGRSLGVVHEEQVLGSGKGARLREADGRQHLSEPVGGGGLDGVFELESLASDAGT
jgi:hypothetical protein